jgi:Bacterial extracellular solute-binding protein
VIEMAVLPPIDRKLPAVIEANMQHGARRFPVRRRLDLLDRTQRPILHLHHVLVLQEHDPLAGTAANAIPVRLARGEWADVLIVVGYALDEQINAGKVLPDSKVDFARSAIGMVVREGMPKPDISSADALRRALLAAKSIV